MTSIRPAVNGFLSKRQTYLLGKKHQRRPLSSSSVTCSNCITTRHQSKKALTFAKTSTTFWNFNLIQQNRITSIRPMDQNAIRHKTTTTPNTIVASTTPITSLLSEAVSEATAAQQRKKSPRTLLATSTGNFRVSPRKLNLISRLIATLPLREALLQCQFSLKRPARRVLIRLQWAEKKLIAEGHDPKHWFVSEAWIGKGAGK